MRSLTIKYFCSIFLFIAIEYNMEAQVGINTDQPKSTFEVVANSSQANHKVISLKNSLDGEVLNLNNNGYIGNNQSNSLSKIDLRNTKDHTLGIGYTNLSPATVGAGAVRYNGTSKKLEFSNGTSWIEFLPSLDRLVVVANNVSGTTLTASANVVSSNVRNWTTIRDNTGSFNPSTGVFTAPREGVYSVVVTLVFDNAPGVGTSVPTYELAIRTLDTNLGLKNLVVYFGGTGTTPLANTCRNLFYLTKGQSVYVSVYMTNMSSPTMATDSSLNMFMVAEM